MIPFFYHTKGDSTKTVAVEFGFVRWLLLFIYLMGFSLQSLFQ